jgi:hypothetical protein
MPGNEEFNFEKVKKLSEDLKKPKPIESTLKKEGEVVIMKSSEPFKQGEINRVLSAASEKHMKNGKLKPKIIEELYDEEDDAYYVYKIISKDGKIKAHKRKSKNETIFD